MMKSTSFLAYVTYNKHIATVYASHLEACSQFTLQPWEVFLLSLVLSYPYSVTDDDDIRK